MGTLQPQLSAEEEEDYHRCSAPWQSLCHEPKPTLPLPLTAFTSKEDALLQHCNFESISTAYQKGLLKETKG